MTRLIGSTRPAIEARKLSRTIGDRMVLDRISLTIAPGQSVAIVGPNGAGKTTLLRCLAGELKPSSGEVYWFGKSPAIDERKHVGLVTHEPRVYSHLTVRENLNFAAAMCGVREPAQRIESLIAGAGLDRLADRFVSQLSRGMRQRLSILRAVVHSPQIVLLDEPTSGFDTRASCWFRQLISDMRDGGSAICFSSHDTELIRGMATNTLRLDSGRLVDSPRPAWVESTRCESLKLCAG